MKLSLNVFFAVSRTYIQHFTVAATSLLENNRGLDITIYVIHDKLTAAEVDTPVRFFKERYDMVLNFIDVGDIDFSIFRLTDNYPKYTYFRLFLADIAPAGMDTALFFDSDVVVTGSLKELAAITPGTDGLFAVSEVSVDDNVKRLNKIGFPVKRYFNSGVIIVNLAAWKKENLSEKFIGIAKTSADQMEWVDQDILNIHFANTYRELDKKFNAIHVTRALPELPKIVHYNTFSKPWHYADTHPYNYLYWQYLKLTPFKNARPVSFSIKNAILKNGRLFKRKLREAGILSYRT